jgi:hypothetical protein
VQKVTLEAAFSEVVKTPAGTMPQTTVLFADYDAGLRRRNGAGSIRILPWLTLTNAPAKVCFSLICAGLGPLFLGFSA